MKLHWSPNLINLQELSNLHNAIPLKFLVIIKCINKSILNILLPMNDHSNALIIRHIQMLYHLMANGSSTVLTIWCTKWPMYWSKRGCFLKTIPVFTKELFMWSIVFMNWMKAVARLSNHTLKSFVLVVITTGSSILNRRGQYYWQPTNTTTQKALNDLDATKVFTMSSEEAIHGNRSYHQQTWLVVTIQMIQCVLDPTTLSLPLYLYIVDACL